MKRASGILRAVALAGVLALAAGCESEAIPIHDLLANTGQYDGKSVMVAGEVTGAAGAFGAGVYQLNDGTGTIIVIAEKGGVPTVGAKIGVQGTFRSALTVGTETVAAIQESKRRAE
jgi:hypothetical protein